MAEYQEYPKHMSHPAFEPAKIGTDADARTGAPAQLGSPMRFPPVLVQNAEQEEYYKAKGYDTIGKSDPAAFASAVANPVPPNYKPQEFPKWVHGVEVRTAEEEAAIIARHAPPAPVKAAAEADPIKERADPAPDEDDGQGEEEDQDDDESSSGEGEDGGEAEKPPAVDSPKPEAKNKTPAKAFSRRV